MNVDGREFRDLFSCSFLSIYGTPEQKFLGGMMGSAFGAWRVRKDPLKDVYVISRHEEGGPRVYVDPDREWMFERLPDGTLRNRMADEKNET